jgi:hypothetical protein
MNFDHQACSTIDELLSNSDWFRDSERTHDEAAAAILVVDDFYPDPHAIRKQALESEFVQYIPPDPAIVGEVLAAENQHRPRRWLSTAFVSYHGKNAQAPFYGTRYNPLSLLERLQNLVREPVDQASWETGGDYWNGAFHLLEGGFQLGDGVIHHHYKPGDVEGRGWSGVVYLSPEAPPSAGTSFWQSRQSGRCVASFDQPYSFDREDFRLAHVAENKFNRLVLFRENVWHRVEHGFASGAEARLTQTLFFKVRQD